jgi:hypothetical protein
MELSLIQHIDSDKLADYQSDIFISTLSNESRCLVIPRLLESLTCRKLALTYDGYDRDNLYNENLKYYQEKGYEVVDVDTEVPDIGVIIYALPDSEAKIILDCTSMSQRWYYEFFSFFGESEDDYKSVNIRFVYTMAGFVHNQSPKKVKGVNEFLKVNGRKNNKKKALFLGLGQEANVSEAICRIEKPDLLYLFYADPPVEKRFVEQVFVNNHNIINSTPIRNLIAYPINNGQVIYQSLIDVILPIRDEYNITMIPQGPKIFSVASMLVHLGYPDTVMSYPVIKRSQQLDRQPCGEPVVLDVYFEGEE